MRYPRILAVIAVPSRRRSSPPSCPGRGPGRRPEPLTVGAVQGSTTTSPRTHRSPLAPASGNGTSSTLYDVRGVVTQKTLARTAAGAAQNGFFLQSRTGTEDGDPTSSDGIFVFMGTFTSLIGGYVPTVGDEIVVRARVSEYFSMTQLSSASLVTRLAAGRPDVRGGRSTTRRRRPTPAAADLFWERHEGMQLRVRAGSGAVSGRNVFSSTADAEIWVIDRDDPLMRAGRPVRAPGLPRPAPAGRRPGPLRQRQRQPHPARPDGREGDRRRQHRAAAAGQDLRRR